MPDAKLKKYSFFALVLVFCTASLNHLLTFLAYDWYAGIDSYSYDVCGLQLISGQVFDVFPIMFRAPLIPIIKNLLYLIFEGHPYILSGLVHGLGILTAILAFRLGSRFRLAVGFALGMLVALNLNISVHFHHISVPTIFIPLLILAADCFVVWVRQPSRRSLIAVTVITIICFLARSEAVILPIIFFIMGWWGHRLWKQAAIFFLTCLLVYNAVSFLYFKAFGYWGITYNSGWALFTRVSRAADQQFAAANGPASRKVGEYMEKQPYAQLINATDYRRYQMGALNLAQQELGFIPADQLFKQAAFESIRSNPWKFIKYSSFRVLGQLDIYYLDKLSFSESPYQTASEHMWGFTADRMLDKKEEFENWRPAVEKAGSPFAWERQAIKSRLAKLFGLKAPAPLLPETFRLSPIILLNEQGGLQFLNCEDGNMGERRQSCRDLDIYFFLKYWGEKGYSREALAILKYWDRLMPRPGLRMNIHRLMWILWIIGILLAKERWRAASLAALLGIVLAYAAALCVFTDNFGGRLALYHRAYLWLGALCGIQAIAERLSIKKKPG